MSKCPLQNKLVAMAERSSKRLRLSQALARAPQNLVQTIQRLLQDDSNSNTQRITLSKRVAREILQPCWNCYEEIQVAASEGPPVRFWAANVQRCARARLGKLTQVQRKMEDTTWRYRACSLVLRRVHLWQCSGHSLVGENRLFFLGRGRNW